MTNSFAQEPAVGLFRKIYTDGAGVGNPGPGGWAAIILLENEKKELKIIEKYLPEQLSDEKILEVINEF